MFMNTTRDTLRQIMVFCFCRHRQYVLLYCSWAFFKTFSIWTYATELICSNYQILHWSIWHVLAMQWKSYRFWVRRRRQFSTRAIQQGTNNLILIVSNLLFITLNLNSLGLENEQRVKTNRNEETSFSPLLIGEVVEWKHAIQ